LRFLLPHRELRALRSRGPILFTRRALSAIHQPVQLHTGRTVMNPTATKQSPLETGSKPWLFWVWAIVLVVCGIICGIKFMG
jgi:hypothetical protein